MPKKGKAKAAAGPVGAAPDPMPASGTSKQQEADEKAANERLWKERAEANKQKAEQSHRQDQNWSARLQEKQRQQEKESREKLRTDKKWEKELQAARDRAKAEGVLQAEDWGDGWWVKLPGDLWKEVQTECWCSLCDKQLNDASLEAHLQSEGHRRKVAWHQPTPAAAGAASTGASRPTAAPGSNSEARAPRGATGPADSRVPTAPMEEWQEVAPAGVRCIPCGKVIDDNHLATDDHKNRLAHWLDSQRARRFGRPAPDLPYLAWVPWELPDGERCLKCLLCGKWVQDETSHIGSFQAPAGSKDHQKNLRNCSVKDPWYQANVVAERRKWHPDEPSAAPTARAAAPERTALAAATPAPWASQAASPTPSRWGKAAAPAAAAPAAAPAAVHTRAPAPAPAAAPPARADSLMAPAPEDGPPLPPGWEAGLADGKPYYFNRDSGESMWEPPPVGSPPPLPRTAPRDPGDLIEV
mmetsp:Transcript_10199/g.30653  ORF Transcript_10199/g.30653 Transcript_10199/m.30653 type:complete len:470 (+) Transcript_10199:91-1500(+)